MKVLGIDPGLGRVGVSVLEKTGSAYIIQDSLLIETPPVEIPRRLELIEISLNKIIQKNKPTYMVTERLMFTKNVKTALDVSKALGVILLVGEKNSIPWIEYTPTQIKQFITGNGAATKKQVEYMASKILGVQTMSKSDDVNDSIAIGLAFLLQARSSALIKMYTNIK